MSKVVLDFGHGGSDQGAQGINITEAVAAQITGNRIKKHLEDMGVEVVLTRSNNSTYPTLTQRAQLAKDVNADAFVAVHYNKFDTVANGFEIYRQTDSNSQSIDFALQDAIYQKVSAVCLKYGVRNRGAKANDYQVLRELQNSGVAAVLIEGLFIDNVADMEFFMSSYHEEYAFSVAEGIVEGLAAVEIIEATPPTNTIIDFVGKAKGDLDNSRIIKYTGSNLTIVPPANVVTEANGGYLGASAVGGTTLMYSITGGVAGRKVQFDFAFNLDKIATRINLIPQLTKIELSEKVANGSTLPRNAKQKLYVWNVTQQAWTNEVIKADETVGGYVTLTVTDNFEDFIDASNNIQFALITHDNSDAGELRVESDHVFLTVSRLV